MHLTLNGKPLERPGPCSLEALLRDLKIQAVCLATVVNDEVVPAARRAARALQDGDRIELLTFAGGG